MVFQSFCYYECFCLVNIVIFSYCDSMIYLVLCTYKFYFDCLATFVCIQQRCIRIFGNSYTIFLNDGLLLKFGFFSYIFRISAIFLDKTVSEL